MAEFWSKYFSLNDFLVCSNNHKFIWWIFKWNQKHLVISAIAIWLKYSEYTFSIEHISVLLIKQVSHIIQSFNLSKNKNIKIKKITKVLTILKVCLSYDQKG